MSHEWNCRCPRCEADEAKYTGPDPADKEAERYEQAAAFANGGSAYDAD